MAVGSGAFALGALITLATYENATEEGGSFVVLIGPILLGVALFVAGLIDLQRGRRDSVAGLRVDPTGRHQRRYWDGRAWTERVADGGRESADPLEEEPEPLQHATSA